LSSEADIDELLGDLVQPLTPPPEAVPADPAPEYGGEPVPDIGIIAKAIIDLMSVPPAPDRVPRDQRRLFAFIAGTLHRQIEELLPQFIGQICDDFADEIDRIVAEEKQVELRLQRVENAREARKCKCEALRQRYKQQAVHLNDARLKGAEAACAATDEDSEVTLTTDDEADASGEQLSSKFDFQCDPLGHMTELYRIELLKLLNMSPAEMHAVQWADYPMSLSAAFLLESISRPALGIARHFWPLPSDSTVYRHYSGALNQQESNLTDQCKIQEQVDVFMKLSGVCKDDIVSVAVDAMAMSPDRSCLGAKSSDYVFVYYAQPLLRRNKCMALHVHRNESGQAGSRVQFNIDQICAALSNRGIEVRYVCSDGDAGYNQRHQQFFKKWYLAILRDGLGAALAAIEKETRMPVSDFLHMWKNFCNKVKNHPVTLCPELDEDVITCEDLEALLELGNALSDKSSIGRMRDSYAVQLFSLINCSDCMEKDEDLALLYLLPWALQEEVIRSPHLLRRERLEKAVLSFFLLLHYFDLSFLPRAEGVTQRFNRKQTVAVTFAEDSVWPRILNNGLLLIDFVIRAPEGWSFSRLGTHCLENFFGFVRQNARADDRAIPAFRIMARATQVSLEMQGLGIKVSHAGRDNVGGVEIWDLPTGLTESRVKMAADLCQSFVAMAGLDFTGSGGLFSRAYLKTYVDMASNRDKHHDNDPTYQKNFTKSSANARVSERNRQAGLGRR
jgi:hypothetical protein